MRACPNAALVPTLFPFLKSGHYPWTLDLQGHLKIPEVGVITGEDLIDNAVPKYMRKEELYIDAFVQIVIEGRLDDLKKSTLAKVG